MKFLIKVGISAGIFLSTVSFVMADCIGVVTAGGGQRYWSEVKKGAELAGKELGVDIYARGAVNEGDIEGQRLVIEEIKKLRCLGLLLAPNSEERKRDVTQLKFLGIPTVYIDRDIGGDRISVIQTDNFLAGELAGTEMAKALKGKGKVAVFRPDKSVVTTTAREKGFITAAVKGGLEIVIDSYVGSAVGIARGNAFNILQEATDIDGIFTPNESTSVAVLATLQSLKKAGEVIHIGFDSNNYLIKALNVNQIYGFIVQNPFQMGYHGVHTVHRALQGKNIKNMIETEFVFVNKSNVDNIKIRLDLN